MKYQKRNIKGKSTTEYWAEYVKQVDRTEYMRQYFQAHKAEKVHATKRRRAREAAADGCHTLEEWQALQEMYGYMCAMCGYYRPLTQDHKIPITKGGSDSIDNIQPLCRPCNSAKAVKTWFASCPIARR